MRQQLILVLSAWNIVAAQGYGSRFGGNLNDDDIADDSLDKRTIDRVALQAFNSGPNIPCSCTNPKCPGVCPNLKFPECDLDLGKCACGVGNNQDPTPTVHIGCANTPNGDLALNPADPTCRAYLLCKNQQIRKRKMCSRDNIFNAAEQRCMMKETVYCPLGRDAAECDQELDVAIVGAGPGGAYSAYKLRQSGKSVGLFEYSDRVGGRTLDYKLPNTPDVYLKMGAMRLTKGVHFRTERILKELDLSITVFALGSHTGGPAGRTRSFLRGQSIKRVDVRSGSVPYFLNAEETQNQDRLFSYYLEKLTGFNESSLSREKLLNLKVADGRRLYKLSLQEVLDLTASPDGKQFLLDSFPFKSLLAEDCSALGIYHDIFGEEFKGTDVYEVDDGFQAMTQGLVNEFLRSNKGQTNRNSLNYNRKLESIRRRRDGTYSLNFRGTNTVEGRTLDSFAEKSTVCAKKVILAMPVHALRQLDWQPLRSPHAKDVYNGVIVSKASKIFMTFDQAWWLNTSFTNNPAYATQRDMLVNQIYDWKKSNETGVFILLVSYADDDNADALRKMQDVGEAMPGSAPGSHKVSTYLRDQVLQSLADVFGVAVATIPQPISAAAQFWTDFPFGGGWVIPRSGYHLDDMVAAMRRPSLTDSVYVVGSDYSWGLNSGWCEGAFETVEEVMRRYF